MEVEHEQSATSSCSFVNCCFCHFHLLTGPFKVSLEDLYNGGGRRVWRPSGLANWIRKHHLSPWDVHRNQKMFASTCMDGPSPFRTAPGSSFIDCCSPLKSLSLPWYNFTDLPSPFTCTGSVGLKRIMFTLPTNISSEQGWSENYFPFGSFWDGIFSGANFAFWGLHSIPWLLT